MNRLIISALFALSMWAETRVVAWHEVAPPAGVPAPAFQENITVVSVDDAAIAGWLISVRYRDNLGTVRSERKIVEAGRSGAWRMATVSFPVPAGSVYLGASSQPLSAGAEVSAK